MYMYIFCVHSVHCSRNQGGKRHLADSELSAWNIKPVSALYRVAAACCQGRSQNGRETFLETKQQHPYSFSEEKGSDQSKADTYTCVCSLQA